MKTISSNSNLTIEEHAHVDVVFSGTLKLYGVLLSISKDTAFIRLDETPPEETTCFIRIYVKFGEIYSRGKVIQSNNNEIFVKLENWFKLIKELSTQAVLSEKGILKQILHAKNDQPKLESCRQEYEKNRKKNCWEVIKCARESICEAAKAEQYDGIFGGTNGGRFCAFISGTSCKDGLPRPDEEKLKLCTNCHFFSMIIKEEFNININ